MAQDSMEIQVHNGPPPFLLYQLQAASKPRPTQDEQEMHFFFFPTKNGHASAEAVPGPVQRWAPELDGAWSYNRPLPPPLRETAITM